MSLRAPLRRALSALLLAALAAGCPGPEGERSGAVLDLPDGTSGEAFPDEAGARGLDYQNRSGEPSKPTILEANGAGVALIDLGPDEDLDVVFSQGLGSLAELLAGPGADVEVFENDGSGRFTRVAGPGLAGWWTGLAVGDVDSDGDQDLAVGGFGDVALLVQDDRGRLVRLEASGVEPEAERRFAPGALRERASRRAPAWATSLAFLDADRDGHLDLYVGRYLDLDPEDPPLHELGEGPLAVPCRWKGLEVFCGPHGLVPQEDRVYRGRGDGTFEDVTRAWLGEPTGGFALGVRPFDADLDRDQDLVVACDSSPNLLWINELEPGGAGGRFVERASAAGMALSQDGRAESGMGVDAGDVDRDGWPNVVVTNFSDEPTELRIARPRGHEIGYDIATFRYGLQAETRRLLSWGAHLHDFDGDGWLELFTANGHVYPQADEPRTGTSYGQPATLWHLGPKPRAIRVEPESERSILAPALGARGSAIGDVDRDGRADLVLARIDGPAALGMNRMGGANHRLAVRCLGPDAPGNALPRTSRDGLGAQVALAVGGVLLRAEVGTAQGYQSASSPWLHFGLGARERYDALTVRWPSGATLELGGGAADRRVWIVEGRGIVREEPFR